MVRRRRNDQPDHYERVLRRIDLDRRNKEMGDPMPGPPPGLDVPIPRRRMRQVTLLLGGALVVLVLGRAATSSRPPALPANCTTPALKLSSSEVRSGGPVRWAATGPTGTVMVALDGKQVSRPGTSLAHCRADGTFITSAKPGKHTVTLVDGRTGAVVATLPLTVTS